jgi:hypothetical protein
MFIYGHRFLRPTQRLRRYQVPFAVAVVVVLLFALQVLAVILRGAKDPEAFNSPPPFEPFNPCPYLIFTLLHPPPALSYQIHLLYPSPPKMRK